MARTDDRLLARLAEPRTRGLRAWEYGMLLGYLQHTRSRPERALDVGSGDSAFPGYLVNSSCVGTAATLDLPEAFEDRSEQAEGPVPGLDRLAGSMLDIPAPDRSFDLVTCISAIEHLDGHSAAHRRDPVANPRLPYARYLEHTRQALSEMARVLAPGGLLYLTTDAYLPDLQQTDSWTKFDTKGVIWSAYRFEDVRSVFVQTLQVADLDVLTPDDLDARALVEDADHSTFRGRYFTTFSLAARRPA